MKNPLHYVMLLGVLLLFQWPGSLHAQTNYCKPSFSGSCSGVQVDSVKVGSNVYSQTTCVTGAIDTTHLASGKPIMLYRGKTYGLRVKASAGAYFGVWLDFNGDGDFADAGETVVVIQLVSDTVISNIKIPVGAKLVNTRMRVIAADPNSGAGTDVQGACGNYGNGEAEDYAVNIAAYNDDISMVSIYEPTQNGCGSSTQALKVVVRNMGKNTVTSIPVVVKVNSTSYSQTFSKTLKMDEQDTLTFTSTANTSTSGKYTILAYTNLSKDEDRTNDTVSSTLSIYTTPSITAASNASRCGEGNFTFTATSKTTGTKTYWYNSAKSDSIIYSGNTFVTPGLTKTTTYYYESQYTLGSSITTKYIATLTNYGVMFDIKAKSSFIIDSFDTHIENTSGVTTGDSIQVYYKEGSYIGNETKSSAWTYVGTARIKAAGAGNPTRVTGFGSIKMEAGKTYAVYLSILSSNGTTYRYYIASKIYSNNDLDLISGATTPSLFGGYTPNREFQGSVYYHYKACASPRASVTGSIYESPLSAKIKESTPFHGTVYDGSAANPDLICPGDTVTYEFTPPTQYTNADLGSKWVITNFSFTTLNGAYPNPKDTFTTRPTATKNATFRFVPSKTYSDSVFQLKMDLKIPNGGCTGSLTRYISVGSAPTANFTFTRVCVGKATTILDSSISSTTSNGYLYDFGDGTKPATTKNATHTYAKAGKYTVTQTITTSKGCTDKISKVVEVYEYPKPKFGATTECVGNPTQFTDSTSNPDEIASWLWKFEGNNTFTSTLQNPTYTYTKPGKYTAKLIVTSLGGCKDSTSRIIEVMPRAKVDFSVTGACNGQEMTFKNTSTLTSGTVTYKWRFEDGFSSTSSTEVKHAFADANSYNVTLIATTGFGCVDSVSKIVRAFTYPKADFSASATCEGKITSFTDMSTDAKTYVWTFGDNTPVSNSQNPTHYFSKAGSYTVKMKTINANGCADSITKTVVVSPLPKANFTFTNTCAGGPMAFTNKSTEANNAKLTYEWTADNGQTSTDENPVFTFNTSGTHNVKLKVTSEGGCQDSIELAAVVTSAPKPNWTKTVDNSDNHIVNFTPDDLTHLSYKWYFGDGDSSTLKTPSHKYKTYGTFPVRLSIINAQGCQGETTTNLVLDSNTVGIAPSRSIEKDFVKIYPNPFHNATRVAFNLAERSQVQVSIYDVQGRKVATLADGKREAGKQEFVFDADKYNAGAGVYILKVLVNNSIYTTQIVNVK